MDAADAVGTADPISSAPSRCGLSARPAPEGPLAATTTTSSAVRQAGVNAGSSARVAVVG